MESWRHVWRNGFVPHISTQALEALLDGLKEDDQKLRQGCTTEPPPLMCVQDWPIEAACALGYCGWKGEELHTVGLVEEYFAKLCYEADQTLGEPAACRHFLNWFDDGYREVVRSELITEVQFNLDQRVIEASK